MKVKTIDDIPNHIGLFYETKRVYITAKNIFKFGEVTGDINPFHHDQEIAKKSIFGEVVAHGFFILSITARFIYKLIEIETGVEITTVKTDRVKYRAPVPANTYIYYTFCLKTCRIITIEKDQRCAQVMWRIKAYRKNRGKNKKKEDTCVLSMEWTVRYNEI